MAVAAAAGACGPLAGLARLPIWRQPRQLVPGRALSGAHTGAHCLSQPAGWRRLTRVGRCRMQARQSQPSHRLTLARAGSGPAVPCRQVCMAAAPGVQHPLARGLSCCGLPVCHLACSRIGPHPRERVPVQVGAGSQGSQALWAWAQLHLAVSLCEAWTGAAPRGAPAEPAAGGAASKVPRSCSWGVLCAAATSAGSRPPSRGPFASALKRPGWCRRQKSACSSTRWASTALPAAWPRRVAQQQSWTWSPRSSRRLSGCALT